MNDEMLDRHIHLIYSTVAAPSAWKDCLKDISTAIGAKAGMIGIDDIQTKTHIASLRHGFSADAIDALAPYHAKCLWTHALINLNPQSFVTSEQILPQKEYLSSELFDGFGRYFDSYHAMGMYFDKLGGQALRMSFLRGKSQGPYDQQEASYLNKLLPHIKHAVSLSRKMFDNDLSMQLTQQRVEDQGYSVFIVDHLGKLVKMNKSAEKSLKNESWIDVSNGKLIFRSGINNSEYMTAIESVTRQYNYDHMRGVIHFLLENREGSNSIFWLLEVSRIQVDMATDLAQIINMQSETLAMVTIRSLSSTHINHSHRLKHCYKLSDSEIEVALQLSKGSTPKQIAEHRNRSVETVRTQIKQLSSKLDVNNVNSLIAKINQLSQ